jgi:hypothetical protein
MKEKLLVLLVAKFKGVPEATLERIATKKAGSVSDEAQLQSVVDGIDFGQILQSEVDSKITDANKKAVQNYETTHKLKDGKPVDQTEDVDPEPKKGKKEDIATMIKEAVAAAFQPLQTELSAIKGDKTLETRKQALESKLKDVPENFKAKVLKDFARMNFEKDEDFNTYLTETDTDIAALNQELANTGLGQHGVPNLLGKKDDAGVSSATKAYIESKAKDNDPLAGKELKTK